MKKYKLIIDKDKDYSWYGIDTAIQCNGEEPTIAAVILPNRKQIMLIVVDPDYVDEPTVTVRLDNRSFKLDYEPAEED